MQVIYSIGGCVFHGKGIGTTAYHAVSGIYRHGLLAQLIVDDYSDSEISPALITRISSRIPGLRKIVGSAWSNVSNDTLHAVLSSYVMKDGDLFHGWAGMSFEAIKKAKKKGMLTFLNRASSHICEARDIIQAEYDKRYLKAAHYIDWAIRRELQEYEMADYILVPSEFARSSFVKRGFPAEKLVLIPFGMEGVAVEEKNEDRVNSGAMNVLFVGEVGFRKGILYALEAWQKADCPKGIFYVVGPIMSDIRPFLKRFESDPTIKFTGFTDPALYYAQADVFVFPSLEEGSALVTYEAMAHGLPLITTLNAGSVVTHDKEGLIVQAGSVDEIKVAIELLANSAPKRSEMGLRAKETVQGYTWHQYGENLVEAYNFAGKKV